VLCGGSSEGGICDGTSRYSHVSCKVRARSWPAAWPWSQDRLMFICLFGCVTVTVMNGKLHVIE